jgi:pSer/pThr/pTyr-binding forkhead associated (FHA) protein
MADRPTQTYVRALLDDDPSTLARRPDSVAAPTFVPLRMRSEIGAEIVEIDQLSATLGRGSTADIRLSAPDISRRHCELFFDLGVWKVRDLSSLNGVYVNDAPVRVAAIHMGDRLRIGSTAFLVERATVRHPNSARIKNETLRSIARVIAEN